jgi:hypothetical protein
VAGRTRVPISRTYALEEVPRALADCTQGALGTFAVRMG